MFIAQIFIYCLGAETNHQLYILRYRRIIYVYNHSFMFILCNVTIIINIDGTLFYLHENLHLGHFVQKTFSGTSPFNSIDSHVTLNNGWYGISSLPIGVYEFELLGRKIGWRLANLSGTMILMMGPSKKDIFKNTGIY